MKRRRIAPAVALGAVMGLCACASLIGLEAVSYEDGSADGGGDADARAAEDGEAGDASVCTGMPCGERCCRTGSVCMESGACSNDVVDVSGGGHGSCALVADGTVWCWGDNALGQVGVDDAGDDACLFISAFGAYQTMDPCRVRATKVEGMPPARAVAAANEAACAIEADGGAVWCWGRNDFGALGHDPDAGDPLCTAYPDGVPDSSVPRVPCNATPQKVVGIPNAAVEVTAGDFTTCARTTIGEVFCWGNGTNGELGDDAGTSRASATKVVGLPNDVVQIAIGLYSQGICAVSDGGRGWYWGANVPEEANTLTARAVTGGQNQPLAELAEIRSGIDHACARKLDGTVICWGYNDTSQLGRGYCDTDGGHPVGTVIGLTPQVAIDNRWLHTCALDAKGVVSCWGVAQDGALGRGTIAGEDKCGDLRTSSTPSPVLGLPRITRIATGIETTFAIDADGRLWAWGADDFGRIGHAPHSVDAGDLTNCGDPGNQTVCNPTPRLVEGLP